MDHFTYKNDQLHAEDVAIAAIAEAVGTPFYCYSRATLLRPLIAPKDIPAYEERLRKKRERLEDPAPVAAPSGNAAAANN